MLRRKLLLWEGQRVAELFSAKLLDFFLLKAENGSYAAAYRTAVQAHCAHFYNELYLRWPEHAVAAAAAASLVSEIVASKSSWSLVV